MARQSMSLPYGATLCDGARSAVNPARPMHLCVGCDRRLTAATHAWQKFMKPIPAKHDGKVWTCEKRVER